MTDLDERRKAIFLEAQQFVEQRFAASPELTYGFAYAECKRMFAALLDINEEEEKLHKSAKAKGMFEGDHENCISQITNDTDFTSPMIKIGDSPTLYVGKCEKNTGMLMQDAIVDTEYFDFMNQDAPKKVRIQLVFQNKSKFLMAFEYDGSETKELMTVLREHYRNAEFSEVKGCFVVNEIVDNYNDYGQKFTALKNDRMLARFNLKMRDPVFPVGADYSLMYLPFDPAMWSKFSTAFYPQIVINVTNNITNVYGNQYVANSGGGNIAISEVASAANVPESKINADYLKWVSSNQPESEEERGVYYARMKEVFPKFRGGKIAHNKFMRALGWMEIRSGSGKYLWMAEQQQQQQQQ